MRSEDRSSPDDNGQYGPGRKSSGSDGDTGLDDLTLKQIRKGACSELERGYDEAKEELEGLGIPQKLLWAFVKHYESGRFK